MQYAKVPFADSVPDGVWSSAGLLQRLRKRGPGALSLGLGLQDNAESKCSAVQCDSKVVSTQLKLLEVDKEFTIFPARPADGHEPEKRTGQAVTETLARVSLTQGSLGSWGPQSPSDSESQATLTVTRQAKLKLLNSWGV